MQPNTYEDWLEVSMERQADANALLCRGKSCGPVYMAGYAVEASLKALLKITRRRFPGGGPEGHNLKALWKASGFQLNDLNDEKGERAFFVEKWSTDLRYEVSYDLHHDTESLVLAAGKLAGWIKTQLRRKNRNRRKK